MIELYDALVTFDKYLPKDHRFFGKACLFLYALHKQDVPLVY